MINVAGHGDRRTHAFFYESGNLDYAFDLIEIYAHFIGNFDGGGRFSPVPIDLYVPRSTRRGGN